MSRVSFPIGGAALVLICGLMLHPTAGRAQDEGPGAEAVPDSAQAHALAKADSSDWRFLGPETYHNEVSGEFTPGKGFNIIKTPRGNLNISFYGLFRWVDQTPGVQTYQDHLGRTVAVNPINQINWHRTFVWLTGFFYVPRFRYNISLWSLPTTQQTLLFGNLQYALGPAATLGVGIGPNLTARSLQGSWPYWASSDRQMAEEFFRGGFSSSFWVTGQPIPRYYYTVALTNNLSQLGVTSSNDTRPLGISGSVWTMPSTGEFGARGGLQDFEHHKRVATRFGISSGHMRESRYAPLSSPPNETQIKMSDGLSPFAANALADSVTVQTLDYNEVAVDVGAKYHGWTVQFEGYVRSLSNFVATGPLPLSSITDRGFMLEGNYMVIPEKLGMYAVTGYVDDQFQRFPWELSAGLDYFPTKLRAVRLNLHYIHVYKSPASSSFGFYTAGQTGNTFSLGVDVLL